MDQVEVSNLISWLACAVPPVAMLVIGVYLARGPRTSTDATGASPQQPTGSRTTGIVMALLGALQLGGLLVFGALMLALSGLIESCSEGFNFTKGRLLRIEGRARLPRRRRGHGWKESLQLDFGDVPMVDRLVLGELWHLAARMEHASIPAFSKLSLQLVAHGAPDDLVARCHEAALDEIDHARRCFAVASAYLGQPLTAGPIPELLRARNEQAQRQREDALVHLAVSSLVDGCLGERVASEAARRAAARARHPGVQAVLEVIAQDERRHAALAEDVVAFCCEAGGQVVRDAVRAERARLPQRESPGKDPVWAVPEQRLAMHGLLTQQELHEVFTDMVQELQSERPTQSWSGPHNQLRLRHPKSLKRREGATRPARGQCAPRLSGLEHLPDALDVNF